MKNWWLKIWMNELIDKKNWQLKNWWLKNWMNELIIGSQKNDNWKIELIDNRIMRN